MKIIATHSNADFDALSSLVSATFLYPDAVGLIPRQVQPSVRQFLGLHREIFHLKTAKDMNLENVSRLIVVDTPIWKRLEDGARLKTMNIPEIILWDHHTRARDIDADQSNYHDMGSTTTLLIREMISRDIAFTPMHATLFLLGIYDDTGNLTYPNTKADDMKASAYLIENGADLNIVNAFLNDSFDANQQNLLKTILDKSETIKHNGVNVMVFHIALDNSVSMLSHVVSKFREVAGADVAIGVFSFYDKSFVIARSILPTFDVCSVVRRLGGGGHPGAASAVVTDPGPEKIYDRVKELILDNNSGFMTAEEIMYMPSESINHNRKISDIREHVRRKRLRHLIVLDDKADFEGAVSDMDIENEFLKGHGNNPVKVLLRKKRITVGRRQSIREVANLMMDNDISVLPVMEDGILLGIVGRNDVMLYLYDI